MSKFFLLLLLSLSFASCKKIGCAQDAGTVKTLSRSIGPFHQIDLYSNMNLVLTQDTTEKIKVEAGERLQPNIEAVVNNGILSIKNTASCSWLSSPSQKITVYLSVKKLDYINYNGSGNITSTNTILTDNISFYSGEGAGTIDISLAAKQTNINIEKNNADIILHGSSDECTVFSHERGVIHLKDFAVKKMSLKYVGFNDASIYVTESLEAIIYHTGNVYYKGSPQITTQFYSSGRLYPL